MDFLRYLLGPMFGASGQQSFGGIPGVTTQTPSHNGGLATQSGAGRPLASAMTVDPMFHNMWGGGHDPLGSYTQYLTRSL